MWPFVLIRGSAERQRESLLQWTFSKLRPVATTNKYVTLPQLFSFFVCFLIIPFCWPSCLGSSSHWVTEPMHCNGRRRIHLEDPRRFLQWGKYIFCNIVSLCSINNLCVVFENINGKFYSRFTSFPKIFFFLNLNWQCLIVEEEQGVHQGQI